MERKEFSIAEFCGRRLLPAAVAFFVVLAGAASAQTVVEPPRLPAQPGTNGVGGGAGLTAPLPLPMPTPNPSTLPPPLPAPSTTTLPPPLPAPTPVVPEAGPPAAAPAAPAEAPAPARAIRFKCDVAPEASGCKDPAAADGGDSGDSQCDCAKDLCYDQLDPATGKQHRVCEKAQ
jgi:hypothetical protein